MCWSLLFTTSLIDLKKRQEFDRSDSTLPLESMVDGRFLHRPLGTRTTSCSFSSFSSFRFFFFFFTLLLSLGVESISQDGLGRGSVVG